MDFVQVLPNLGIGVVAILTLGYITREFILHLRSTHTEHRIELAELHTVHLAGMKEANSEMRDIEREVRTNITAQLAKNTSVMEKALMVLNR